MGGDYGPETTIKGVLMASKIYPHVKFKLFGNKNKSLVQLNENQMSNFDFIHTLENIKSDDEPVSALRKLKKSSMRLGINEVKSKKADGFVSAGNTGALMAISKFVLRTLKGINRPAIAGLMPTLKGQTVILDLGANVDCTNENLFQFALMGDIFAQTVLGIQKPKIGLLNVGSEHTKGNSTVKQTHSDLSKIEKKNKFSWFCRGK